MLLARSGAGPENKKTDRWVPPLEGDTKPFPFLQTEFNNGDGQFSPDGRWVAYVSDESGRKNIHVRTFSRGSARESSDAAEKWLISTAGGNQPRWRGGGKELYYLAPDGKLMVVEIATNPAFRAAAPKVLLLTPQSAAPSEFYSWEVTPDGKRFLFPVPAVQAPPPLSPRC